MLGLGSFGPFMGSYALEPEKKTVIKPRRLQKGGTIGIISPSSRLPGLKQYDRIVDQVKSLGYGVKEGPNARNRYGYLAGSDEERAADLNAMFADDTVDAILPFRGGWGGNRILSMVDYDLIANNPKILVGFSDITSLLLAIYAKTGLITFHGPVGKSDWTDYTLTHFERMLSGQQATTIGIPENSTCSDCRELSVITPGETKGTLLGGNLSVLTAMIGSDYLPDWQGSILFLEDVGEDIYRIDRMLTQLKISGILEQLSGFIFGQCVNCDRANDYSLSLKQVFEDHIKPLGIPAFSGAMIGHISDMVTLPIGLEARMDAKTGTIHFEEAATRP